MMTQRDIPFCLSAALFASLLLSACERDPVRKEPLAVSFTLPSGDDTKATPYSGASDNPQKVILPKTVSLGIVAYTHASADAPASDWTRYPSSAVIRADCDNSRSGASSQKWVPNTQLLWPGGTGYIRFFGYAPFDDRITVTAQNNAVPSVSFTVPDNWDEQIDLIVTDAASSCAREDNPPVTAIDVPLNFRHALTGIRFRVPVGCTIQQIMVSGVYSSGSLPLPYDSNDEIVWNQNTSSTASYTITGTNSNPILLTKDNSDTRYDIVKDEYTLLLLPQTLPAGSKITVSYTNNGVSRTVEALMDDIVWRPGHLLVYTVTLATPENPTITFEDFDGMTQEHEDTDFLRNWN